MPSLALPIHTHTYKAMCRVSAAVFGYQCLWAQLGVCQMSGLFDLHWLTSNGRRALGQTRQALCVAWRWTVAPAGMLTPTQFTRENKDNVSVFIHKPSVFFSRNYFSAEIHLHLRFVDIFFFYPTVMSAQRRTDLIYVRHNKRALRFSTYSAQCPNDNHNVSHWVPLS